MLGGALADLPDPTVEAEVLAAFRAQVKAMTAGVFAALQLSAGLFGDRG